MKLKHFFAFGAFSAGALAVMALDTIPLTFKEGQVISAGTMNAMFARVNRITRVPAQPDLVGSWDCTETVPRAIGTTFVSRNSSGVLATRKNTFVFGAPDVEGIMSFSAQYAPFQSESTSPGSDPSIVVFDVAAINAGSRLLMVGQRSAAHWQPLIFSYLDSAQLEATANSPLFTNGALSCIKTNAPPAPADALTASTVGDTVELVWVDQSSTETGFRIEQKTSINGEWTAVQNADAGASTSNIKLLPGTYWFRVIAFNTTGNAMASGEVQVTVAP